MRPSLVVLIGLVLALLSAPAAAVGPDPATRGLDVFLHMAGTAPPGGTLALTLEAYGFATATRPAPLPGATLEVGWDPDSLDGAVPPASVTATADSTGRATLTVPVPDGKEKAIALLVSVRHGTHARTRSFEVRRTASANVEIHVADTRVVPSSTISTWVRVTDPRGAPLPNTNVEVALLEGDVARHTEKGKSDRGGLVMARVPIPRVDEPGWRWTLRATADVPGQPRNEMTLSVRDETPGKPKLDVAWETPPGGAHPGDRVPWVVRLRDATGEPVVGHDVGFWVGPASATELDEEAWKKAATFAKTDAAGRVERVHPTPTLVKSSGTRLLLRARANLEGHVLDEKIRLDVGQGSASASVDLETEALVPGLPQRVHLTVTDARGEPVRGRFEVKGDGLSADVVTDAHGEAAIPWSVPAEIGAFRGAGPCANDVAAAVVIRPLQDLAALSNRRDPLTTCVVVNRDATALVRVEPSLAKPGETVHVTLTGRKPLRDGASVVLAADHHPMATTAWLAPRADGTLAGSVVVPDGASAGVWTASVVSPSASSADDASATRLLVAPSVLPKVDVRVVGGRAAPGGSLEIEARLTDGRGAGLPGSVSAVVMDAMGGARVDVSSLDTRTRLCRSLGGSTSESACAALVEDASGADAERRGRLGALHGGVHKAASHPTASARATMDRVFFDVVHSLEGAVYESLKRPGALVDVRRKVGGRWTLNPELFTLATDAMSEPPITPGGEAVTLTDVVAIDPQVTFDNVARRVTRLVLFQVLMALRDERKNRALDPNEPVFRDPNALLRRLVRDGQLQDSALLDPWGGTLKFVKATAPQAAFLDVARGWELRSPGPDGVLGNADDVRDPFARVLASGTPYANAVEEDRIVDAKWDMVVGDDTVNAWKTMFERLTGTQLGLQGVGEGGGGMGSGIGLGRLGTVGHGSGRGGMGVSNGDAYWSAPVRTDAEGRVRLTVPLGDVDTTWSLAIVGVPDGHGPAATVLPIVSGIPLSARVVGGARWVEGDAVEARVVVRNRTAAPLRAQVRVAAEGVVELDKASPEVVVDVGAQGMSVVKVRLRAKSAGEARLVVTTRGLGASVPEDVLRHTWEVVPAGEKRALTKTDWIDGERALGLELDHGYRLDGTPRLVLERGYDDAVAAALDSLEPERQTSFVGLVDALDAATRIERWATTQDSPRHRALAGIAKSTAARAQGRATALLHVAKDDLVRREWTTLTRLRSLASREKLSDSECPPVGEAALDAEPPPERNTPPCWGAFVSSASTQLATETDPAILAGALVALAERPHRAAIASSLASRLRTLVRLRPDGEIEPPAGTLPTRASRATVYAALLRTSSLGSSPASASTLFGKLAVLRDVTGSYGSSAATLAAVRALLASQLAGHGTTRARVRASGFDRRVDIPESGSVTLPLPPGTLDVTVTTEGPGLVARLERPVLRAWTRPPPAQQSSVGLEAVWPAEIRAGEVGTLRLTTSVAVDDARDVDIRIPLPPGASLAASSASLTQVQGVLVVRERVGRSPSVAEVPIRFALAGRVTVPEAVARLARDPGAPAVAPARPLVVR